MRHFLESCLKETKPACPNIIPILLNKYALFHSFIPSTDIYQRSLLRVKPHPAGSGIGAGAEGNGCEEAHLLQPLPGEPRQSSTEDSARGYGKL